MAKKETSVSVRTPPSADLRRVAIEAYRDGSGWFAHSPRGGGVGTVYATAETADELVKWARKLKIQPTVID